MVPNNKDVFFTGIDNAQMHLSGLFEEQFPTMTLLLKKAIAIDMVINSNQRFRQYIWKAKTGNTCGWLSRLEHIVPQDRTYLPEHIMLAQTMGGIVEFWGEENHTLLLNKETTFSLKNSFTGLAGMEDVYVEQCEEEGFTPIDTSVLIGFSLEANGDLSCYNNRTGEVVHFAHDGYSPYNIIRLNRQPEYAFYHIEKAATFAQYVAAIAEEWLQLVE